MAGGLKGLLLLDKGKGGPSPDEGADDMPEGDGEGDSVETELFGKAFDALKAGNRDAFARMLKQGIDICVDKAQAEEY